MTIRRRTQSANSADQNGPVLTPNNCSLIRVRDACQSYPPFDAVSPPFKHGSIRYGRTASAADRAVLVELRRLLACAVERRAFLAGASPVRQLSLQPVVARAVHGGNDMS